jgi:hypothetical protein
MREPQLNLLVLYSSNVIACKAFYESLGLIFTTERHGEGPEHVAARLAGGVVLEIYPAGRKGPTGALRLGLNVTTGHVPAGQLHPGRHLLRDPDDRAVDVTISS